MIAPGAAVPAIVLAGGGSRRLGRPKQLVWVEGEPLLARSLQAAQACGAQPVIVVLGAAAAQVRASVDLGAVQVIVNEGWEQGIASSIQAGLRFAEQFVSDGVLIVACDQPRLSAAHLRQMLAAFSGNTEAMVASTYADTRGIPAIFPRALFCQLHRLDADRGARSLLYDETRTVIEVPFDGGEIDIDTQADLVRLG